MESTTFPAMIEGKEYRLDARLYRPKNTGRYPLIVFSHGRNGKNPSRDYTMLDWYQSVCQSLASEGYAVVYFVRRGYGNSEGEGSSPVDLFRERQVDFRPHGGKDVYGLYRCRRQGKHANAPALGQ